MAKKRILRTEELFAETEEVAAALVGQVGGGPQHVAIDRLVPNRYNSRQTYPLDAQRELTRSMREHGFIGSLDGRQLADGRIELAYGSRRLLAARDAGLRTVPVALHDWSDAEMCFVSLAENLARQQLQPEDEAELILRLRDGLGLDGMAIASRSGRPGQWVEERLAAGDASDTSPEDEESAMLDAVIASIIGDADQGRVEAPIYGLDVGRGAEMGSSPTPVPARRKAQATAPAGAPSRGWVETGSTMLVLATELLEAFEPGAVPEEELGDALDSLARLEERVKLFREALKARAN
jgi:ParB/RepB/Spo0J family partition protein